MGFGKRKVPVTPAKGHPLADEMPLGQLPLDEPKPQRAPADAPPVAEMQMSQAPAAPTAAAFDADRFAPRNDGGPPRQRVFPASLWEGEHGDMLRELGFDPNDETNFVPDAHALNQRLDRDKTAFEAKLADTNSNIAARIPGGQMRGFSLLPDACWNGRTGHFLTLRLGFSPYEDWNLILLPANMDTAEALNLPLHPGKDIPAFVDAAERFMNDAIEYIEAAHAGAARTQEFAGFHEALDETREKVRGLARKFLSELDKAWEDRNA